MLVDHESIVVAESEAVAAAVPSKASVRVTDPTVTPLNVGVAVELISCGSDTVTDPVEADTDTWFVVPVSPVTPLLEIAPVVSLYDKPVPTELPIASCALSSVKYLFVEPSLISSVPSVRVPPSDVDVPLIVIAELSSDEFGIFESVFAEPLIVLFVSV